MDRAQDGHGGGEGSGSAMGIQDVPVVAGQGQKQANGKMTGLAQDELSFRVVLVQEPRWSGPRVVLELRREARIERRIWVLGVPIKRGRRHLAERWETLNSGGWCVFLVCPVFICEKY